MGFTVQRVLRKVLRRGSEKGVSKRRLERPLGEYDSLGVHPSLVFAVDVWVDFFLAFFAEPRSSVKGSGVFSEVQRRIISQKDLLLVFQCFTVSVEGMVLVERLVTRKVVSALLRNGKSPHTLSMSGGFAKVDTLPHASNLSNILCQATCCLQIISLEHC